METPKVIAFDNKFDPRGNLSFVEGLKGVPFKIKRVYWLYDVPDQQERGGHAHKSSKQVIICTKGQINISLESKRGDKMDFILDSPEMGLYIPPLWWGKMVFQDQAMMIGLASDDFSEKDYIRIRKEF